MNDESSKGFGANASGSLVALKDRRTQVTATLSHAFAHNTLDVDELDRRLELVHRAQTVAELDALVADVEAVEPRALRAPASAVTAVSLPAPSQALVTIDRPERQSLVTIMGGIERSGRWTVPSRLNVHCMMGGVSLDFREADLAPGVTEVSILCMMGGVEVIVPPNVNVEVAGSAILGGFDQSHPGADALTVEPIATLRITGVAFAGGVGIETRRIGESSRQARKRIKSERKQLSEGPRPGRAALPAAVVLPDRKSKR